VRRQIMSMFSKKSRALVGDPARVMAQLRSVLKSAKTGQIFTLDDLTDEVRAERKETVAFLLAQLSAEKIVDQFIRVDSPRGGGIREFVSYDQIPSMIEDPFQLQDIPVEPGMIRVFYRKRDGRHQEASNEPQQVRA
jgi:hypothetical protein